MTRTRREMKRETTTLTETSRHTQIVGQREIRRDLCEGKREEDGFGTRSRLVETDEASRLQICEDDAEKALQQQQCYEREAALAEIDYSRKKLLNKLREYKGEELEVIHEATAFASESVEDHNDLLLPPYPSRPPRSLVSDSGYLSNFPSKRKSFQNGIITGDPTESQRNQAQPGSKNQLKGFRFFINTAAKTVLTLVGVISVLSLAGFEPKLRKKDRQFNFFSLFQLQEGEAKGGVVQCPPEKVTVFENGEVRCLVKERVEIPFESVIATPNVNYGCG